MNEIPALRYFGSRDDIEREHPAEMSAVKMLLERYESAPCDSRAVASCVRCNVMYLARVIPDLLELSHARAVENAELSGERPPYSETWRCSNCGDTFTTDKRIEFVSRCHCGSPSAGWHKVSPKQLAQEADAEALRGGSPTRHTTSMGTADARLVNEEAK